MPGGMGRPNGAGQASGEVSAEFNIVEGSNYFTGVTGK